MNIKEIVAVRKANGLRQYDFAELIGVPIGTWSNVEAGRQPLYAEKEAIASKVLHDLNCDFSILEDPEAMEKLPKYVDGRRQTAPSHVEKPAVKVAESTYTPEPKSTFKEFLDSVEHDEVEQIIYNVAMEIYDILIKKNHDYGDSVFDTYKEFGDLTMYMRLKDKMGRLRTIVKGEDMRVTEETLNDIYRDIAGYSILALVNKQRLNQSGE